ncbi:glycosaminoglycan xylosylkinase [Harpegnathos saltator]|uniref:glycosaminoglycan xylosylkinase n=1 Tax=Harpegnathos saltator TaxID=610380 RepID=UPI00058FCC08|nr:glycosaminoglycan xylosylkinase [Harpegnathos saltator]XP_011155256.1 glycosaminoglycan xylosylkinase [Harpegnathos saltator]XP_011155257.1 glycosaminoglycan xylosylkinase [Harpegnathos saltator]
MIDRRCALFALGTLLILVLGVNVYFIRTIVESSSQKIYSKNLPVSVSKSRQDISTSSRPIERDSQLQLRPIAKDMGEKIREQIRTLPSKYFKQNTSYSLVLERLLAELRIMPNVREDIWNIPNNNWPDAHQLIPPAAPELGTILEILRRSKVIRADNAPLGTQLKLMLNLENGVRALFKPQWYSRDTVLHGPVYFGKDRHNAEVVAFHLSSLLALRRVPLVVARKLDLKEIRDRATPALYTTMYQEGNDTCLYGVCHYCSPADPVCGVGDILEGALIFWLPRYLRLVKHRHPWQRTYKRNKFATWEIDEAYCDKVKDSKAYSPQSSSRLLDLIDTAIFDFLIDNGDRHHYELAQNNFHNPAVLLIDNGKSLGNPDVDHLDILAPLYQCCMIHKTTWDRLRLFSGGSLSVALGKLVAHEAEISQVSPLITEAHLSAMDRRLLTVYAIVENCLSEKKYASNVILDHR